MSTRDFGKKINRHRQQVEQIESGELPLTHSPKLLKKIARVLGLKASKLMSCRRKRKLKHVKSKTPLGQFLVDTRLAIDMSQDEVADLAGISVTTLCLVERGNRVLKPSTLHRNARSLLI